MALYPVSKSNFLVEWGGARIGFAEVSGLEVSTDVIKNRKGSRSVFGKVKMPGMQKFTNITLKRGTFKRDNEFHDWWNTVALNTIERRDVTISLLNENHEPVAVWKVAKARPTKVQSTNLKADGNEVAIESIELVHEGLKVQKK
jgi:phage tail-like protein